MQSCRLQPLESTGGTPVTRRLRFLLFARRVDTETGETTLARSSTVGFCASQPWSQNKNPPFKNEASAQRQDRHRRRARLLGKKRKRGGMFIISATSTPTGQAAVSRS